MVKLACGYTDEPSYDIGKHAFHFHLLQKFCTDDNVRKYYNTNKMLNVPIFH